LKTRAYLSFKEVGQSPSGKTRIWGVYAEGDDQLGEVKWYAPWREYCYFQNSEIVMSSNCLTEVAVFLAKQKHWHKVSTDSSEPEK